MKGEFQQECYRTACSNTNAVFYNHSTRQHYCAECAKLINTANHADAMRLYGHHLCTLAGDFKVQIREYEKGWGSKQDEVKDFHTKEEADKFIKEYNSENNKEVVPDWYMAASPLNY